jgi:hypothetical protein
LSLNNKKNRLGDNQTTVYCRYYLCHSVDDVFE